jgi:adenine-specific DNA-methyltransferase
MIDDNEVHHLKCQLEAIFPAHEHFTIVVEHNKRGRQGEEFAKTHEYALVVTPSAPGAIGEQPADGVLGGETRNLRRTGNNSLRTRREGQFYPVWVDRETLKVVEVGEPLGAGLSRDSVQSRIGLVPVWPIDNDGVERNWHYAPGRTKRELGLGKVFAKRRKGLVNIYYTLREKDSKRWKTVWSYPLLDASTHGTEMLTTVLGRTSAFSFPKSLYATKECIATAVLHRPKALVVDFFAGSGTSLHAVNLLNAQDGGHRRCIVVTNNEVSAVEAEELRSQEVHPGDDEWERMGICRSVTWPRSKFTILGRRDDGTEVDGYIFTGDRVEKEKARTFAHIGFGLAPVRRSP